MQQIHQNLPFLPVCLLPSLFSSLLLLFRVALSSPSFSGDNNGVEKGEKEVGGAQKVSACDGKAPVVLQLLLSERVVVAFRVFPFQQGR